ncbi:hypothetical protein F5051DRAFT_420399 [Lentinula edodes]|nr:hypothetical protein F5051DRAFT_420399 [Lentinula edodes]
MPSSSWAPESVQTSKFQPPPFTSPAIKVPVMENDYDFIPHPSIDNEVIAEIACHNFAASSLWKLVVSAGRIVPGHPIGSPDDHDPYLQYPTIESLLPHIFAYFSILASCARLSGMNSVACTVMNGSYIYVVSLIDMANQFEWPYVLGYHIGYMNKRLQEMRRGDYTGWGPIDLDLYLRVLPHPRLVRKSASFGESDARQGPPPLNGGKQGIDLASGRDNRRESYYFLALHIVLITFSIVYIVYTK